MFFKKKIFYKISRNIKKPIKLFNNDIDLNKNYIKIFNNSFISILLFDNRFFLKKKNDFLYFFFFENLKFNNIIGTFYSIIKNIICGFLNFFEKKLILVGIGYKFILHKKFLYIFLGFSHPIIFKIPEFIKIKFISFTEIVVYGVDKQKVNLISSLIKKLKKFNIYKGKGIFYHNEKFKLKIFKKK